MYGAVLFRHLNLIKFVRFVFRSVKKSEHPKILAKNIDLVKKQY